MSIEYKKCQTCEQELLKNNFVSSRNYVANGESKKYYRKICKECYNKAHLKKNSDYYEKHKDKIKEKMKERYRKNKDLNIAMRHNFITYLEKLLPVEILKQIVEQK